MTGVLTARPVPILCYHNIAWTCSDVMRPFAVTPAVFFEHLSYLRRRGATTITVAELADARRRGRALPPETVAITFDDGFADLRTNALPALQHHGFSATAFVVTDFVRQRRAAGMGADPVASWDDLRWLAAAGVEIGAHSHTHAPLDVLPRAAVRDELRASKTILEDGLGRPVRTVAYPYGYCSRLVQDEARQAGFVAGCKVGQRRCRSGDDLFALPRITVAAGTSTVGLGRWLDGHGPHGLAGNRLAVAAWRAVRRRRAEGVRSRS